MKNTYSVGQINSYIKNMFAQDYLLHSVYVKGEVSNVTYHSSGHIYFTMKDNTGTLSCVMFAGSRKGLKFRLVQGQQIITGGSIEVFERDGKYQMYAREIVLDGVGQLYERFEQLKRELSDMGMFAEEYKKPIPKYISTLGVVTAPTGAAIRDIINITKRRNPHVRIILYPAKVQGEGAVESIINGIRALETKGVDVMIVGRGGGSIEDLWAFNEEEVARAIFDCDIPIISAVGHETDTTIADYVADMRAPTPSAGAELAVFDHKAFMDDLKIRRQKYLDTLENAVEKKRGIYEKLLLKLNNLSPEHRIREQKMRIITSRDRMKDIMMTAISDTGRLLEKDRDQMNKLMKDGLVSMKHELEIRIERMEALAPHRRLNGGYVFAEGKDGRPLTSAGRVNKGDDITVHFKDGKAQALITEVEVNEGRNNND